MRRRRGVAAAVGVVGIVGIGGIVGGCGLDFTSVAQPDASMPADDVAPNPDPSITIVTVRFRNLAVVEAVNVEFYATNSPLASVPDDLFVADNLVTSSIGVAGTGIIEPLREDVLNFPCTSDLVLGTLGGSFLDNETGDLLGMGNQRWVQESALGLCGREVLLEYGLFSGEFGVRISIND